jgi:hypothetical protein
MRVKSYVNYVHKRYRWYRDYVGTTVTWWEFDRLNSTSHPVYDEGPERIYKLPFILPVMVVLRDEDRKTPREEGFYAVSTAHLTFGTDMAARAGMSDPHNARLHLFDRFLWDDKYFEVRRFQIAGRLKKFEVVIGVDATALSEEEFVNDPHWPPG